MLRHTFCIKEKKFLWKRIYRTFPAFFLAKTKYTFHIRRRLFISRTYMPSRDLPDIWISPKEKRLAGSGNVSVPEIAAKNAFIRDIWTFPMYLISQEKKNIVPSNWKKFDFFSISHLFWRVYLFISSRSSLYLQDANQVLLLRAKQPPRGDHEVNKFEKNTNCLFLFLYTFGHPRGVALFGISPWRIDSLMFGGTHPTPPFPT